MNSIEEICTAVRKNTSAADRTVKGLWNTRCLYNPANNGRIFDCNFIVSQTKGQGCAYSVTTPNEDELYKVIGKDFLDAHIDNYALLVSLLDSLYPSICDMQPNRKYIFDNISEEKMKERTNIIYNEAKNLLGDVRNKKVVNVGVVGDIIKKFVEGGAETVGTDYDQVIVGRKLFNEAEIFDGSNTLDMVEEADLAIVTGMTIVTKAIDDIIECCNKNNTKLIIFAETGANLYQYYINAGADVFVSEPFPFYIFNGVSTINVYKKQS